MKYARSIVISIVVVAGGLVALATPAAATELGNKTVISNTDFASFGVGGMRGGDGSGTITVDEGVSGTVSKALLYWNGPTNGDASVNAEVNFDGAPITGTNIGTSDDNCWDTFANSQSYQADVTTAVNARTGGPSGTYLLSGFRKTIGGSTPTVEADINGVSLVVFFSDGDVANNRDVTIVEGNDSNVTNDVDSNGWDSTIPGVDYVSGTASLQLHVSDGQSIFDDGNVDINTDPFLLQGDNFAGDTVPGSGEGTGGNLWDITNYDITDFLEAGPNDVHLTSPYFDDCLSLVVALVDVPSEQPTEHTLSVDLTGDGTGEVFTDDPPGISCPGIEGPCLNQFADGSEVTLTATPDEGSDFTGWTGCDSTDGNLCNVTMNADKNVTAAFELEPPPASADLSITKTDGNPVAAPGYGPDPVSSGNVVAYKVSVTNNGLDAATGIEVTDTVTGGGTIVDASGTGWSCPGPFNTTTTTCTRASLANGALAEITVLVQAPTTSTGTTINDTATVSGNESDPTPANNSDTESTAVNSSGTDDHAAAFCPSTGCTISTDGGAAGASPGDPTVSTLDVPAGVDPQTITLDESTSTTFCGGAPCQGQILTITSSLDPMTFSGVDDPTVPVELTMVFDKTVKQGSKVYIKKGSVTTVVKNCTTAGVAIPGPCVSAKNILVAGGDRAFIILFTEGDPIIGKR